MMKEKNYKGHSNLYKKKTSKISYFIKQCDIQNVTNKKI